MQRIKREREREMERRRKEFMQRKEEENVPLGSPDLKKNASRSFPFQKKSFIARRDHVDPTRQPEICYRNTLTCQICTDPTNVASLNLVTGCSNARKGVKIVEEKKHS